MESDSVLDSQFGTLSPNALMQLISADVVPHYILDLRTPEQAERKPAPETLRRATGGFLNVPTSEIRKVFSRRASGEFSARFAPVPYPRKDDLIVCISDEVKDCRKAVQEMESLGYDCSVYLKGGFDSIATRPLSNSNLTRSSTVKHISRHAVALLLNLTDIPSPVDSTVMDLRRVDELVIFGSIQGTKHLVVNELPKALTLDAAAFQERYQFPKPGTEDVVITSCRTNKRAIWAAHLLTEAGYTKVFVHHTGTYGWRFSPSVKPYDSYNQGEEIPAPKEFTKEHSDASAGLRELEDLGLISLSKDSTRSSFHLSAENVQNPTRLEDSAIVYFSNNRPPNLSSNRADASN